MWSRLSSQVSPMTPLSFTGRLSFWSQLFQFIVLFRETFAPIIYLLKCSSFDEGISWNNEVNID